MFDFADPARLEFLTHVIECDLLVLDDFLTTPINGATANEIFNLLAAREGKGSTIVTSQFAPDEWYESMPDRVVAESLLNRRECPIVCVRGLGLQVVRESVEVRHG